MSRKVIVQAIGGSLLVAIFWIALLVSAPPILGSMAGVHPAQTGIMLIAPAYHHQHNTEYEV
jgi:hypothetical protein